MNDLDTLGTYGRLLPVERVVINGVSYSGKTYTADKLVATATRRVFFSPMPNDYAGPGRTETSVRELCANPTLLRGSHVALVVRPESDTEDGIAREVVALIRLCRKVASTDKRIRGLGWGGLVLVLDEVGDYRDGWFEDADGRKQRCYVELTNLARNGRHHNLVTVYVSQSAVDIPKGVRRQATRWLSLCQTEPADLDALEEKCGEDYRAAVEAWQPGQPAVEWVIPTLRNPEWIHRTMKGRDDNDVA